MAGQPVRLDSNGQFIASPQPVATYRLGQPQAIAAHRLGQPATHPIAQPEPIGMHRVGRSGLGSQVATQRHGQSPSIMAAQRLGQSPSIMAAQRLALPQPVQYSEYQLRVPKNLVKKYNVMSINAPRPIKLDEVKEANMIRKTRKQVYVEEEGPTAPQYGAGSVYKSDQKEEAKKKKRGYIRKQVSRDDLPYALRLGGKGGKKYTGRKEATILEHSAYFIFTQTADGVFEAIPVQGWYNFIPDVAYTTLTSDEVEVEFSRRTKSIEFISQKYNLKDSGGTDEKFSKVQDRDGSLIIHDDIDYDLEDDLELSDEEDEKKPKASTAAAEKKKEKGKTRFHGKKKHQTTESGSEPEDSDEEEELDRGESKEVDYMSESSSEDEEEQMDDDPEPETGGHEGKAKDDLNQFSDSNSDSDAEDENKDLNEAGKELRAIMKKEAGEEDGGGSSDEEDEDDDEDLDEEKYSKSALFMQEGKKKKGGSKSGSRSNTPVPPEGPSDTSKIGSKRPNSRVGQTDSPTPKKMKVEPGVEAKRSPSSKPGVEARRSPSSKSGVEARRSPSSRSNTPIGGESSSSSSGMIAITEELIRKHLLHKPLTTTDLVRKFKTKKTGLSKEQTVAAIAAVLKRIAPTQQKIDGKLYLSLKPNNGKK